ncbi:MAG: nucleotide exchange factor GrpE [Clostridiales bacterium]|nr:nucleotide exchange factor GrpE [Clostridiales bacterium]
MAKKAQNKDSAKPFDEAKAESAETAAAGGEEAKDENKTQEAAAQEAQGEAPAAADAGILQELDDTKDMLLRLKAEYANFRKRSEKEKADAFSFATANAVKELLPVIDNLERALQNEGEDYAALKKGVEMTYNGVTGSFEKLGVEIFAEKGDIFDPELHNAVLHIESADYKDGEIVEVYQKGCRLGDKIIRPAMVKTAN